MRKNPKLRIKLHETAPKQETAVLVAVSNNKQSAAKTREYLDELAFLALTMNVNTLGRFTQLLDRPDKRTYVGKGKLEEIRAFVQHKGCDMVIFDDDLSPSQLRNVESELGVKIYDRSLLILDIFSARAKTSQAYTQVEVARLKYMLPRLTRLWSHLERQRGGTGTRSGSGEQEIETDRRTLKTQITILKEKLAKIDLQGHTQRKSRGEVVRVALVGYTNVGKSTIMNMIAKVDLFAENKLFATVDSTVRKVVLDRVPFLLSDTVGFIRKLPTLLIESFKSTLDEVREADILLHVVDVSHPNFEEHINVVNTTLAEIKAVDKKIILVFNKIDQYENPDADNLVTTKPTLLQLMETHLNKQEYRAIFISALEKENIEELRKIISQTVNDQHHLLYPNYLFPEVDYEAMTKEFNEQQSKLDELI